MTLAPIHSEAPAPEFSAIRPLASFPAPYASRLRAAWDFYLRIETFHERCRQTGDRFVVQFPGSPPMLGLTRPDDVKAVFTGDPVVFSLGDLGRRTQPHERVIGPEVLEEGPAHMRRRRMMNPYFHGKALEKLTPTIVEKIETAVADWPMDREVPFKGLIQPVVMEVIIAAIFGVSEGERAARIREAAYGFLRVLSSKRFLLDFVIAMKRGGEWRPGGQPYLQAHMDAVDAVIREEIAERRAQAGGERADLLDAYLCARNDEGDPIPDQQILNTMRGLLVAGYDTTATSMTWLMERLARNPAVLNRLYDEIDAGETDYIEAAVYEGLRTRPPLSFTGRMIMKPTVMNDVELRPGTLVVPFMWLIHHRPDVYPDPDKFDPDRFYRKRPDRYAWIPFGGGVHICLGMPLALLELNTFLRSILGKFRLVPTDRPGERIRRQTAIVLAPAEGARVTFARR
jgi:cytochrome P450